jgi:hypothetical protein
MTFKVETDSTILQQIAKDAEAFAEKHVVEMCKEMLEWSATTVLSEGRVRELSRLVRPMAGYDALRVAESYVRNAAFDFVAKHGVTE